MPMPRSALLTLRNRDVPIAWVLALDLSQKCREVRACLLKVRDVRAIGEREKVGRPACKDQVPESPTRAAACPVLVVLPVLRFTAQRAARPAPRRNESES